MSIQLAPTPEANAVLDRSDLALLIGLLLDQQVPMERAFAAPAELQRRLRRELDVADLAQRDPDDLVAVFAERPALHRFPGAMARRVQALCQHLLDHYGGDPGGIWATGTDGHTVLQRLAGLPGFGKAKAQITLALLAKQRGVQPAGWREAAGPYGEPGVFRSIADVVDDDTRQRVRDYKRQLKAQAATD